MAYTTASEVRAIISEDDPKRDITDMTPFIAAANSVVVTRLGSSGLSTATLTQIEKWLAAHFYCIMQSRTNMENADNIISQFQSRVDLGLDVTHYGQMAKLLDPTGILARTDFEDKNQGKIKQSIRWLGKIPRRNFPYGWPGPY